jgi:CMP-N,N'-diacetyllegionaminic acid synthase
MLDGHRILAVVPARGGSKGIPLKNLRKVGGVSLVTRVGHVISKLPMIDRAIVSTDHEEILQAAAEAGLMAPFRRPDQLSGPATGDWDVLDHALKVIETLDHVLYDIILMLQPTSPSRTPQHVEKTLRRLIDGAFDAVWTVSETDSKGHPLKQLTIDAAEALEYYDSRGAEIVARQQLTPLYHRNGIAYAFTRECIVAQKTIKGRRTGAVVINEPVANIDTELDLIWAEFLLRQSKRV